MLVEFKTQSLISMIFNFILCTAITVFGLRVLKECAPMYISDHCQHV
jgi:hypothetical protein